MVQLQSERAVQDLPRGRILLVDDDPGLLRLLSIRLRAERYDVEAVESAAEALAALSRFRPDLVISDLRMAPSSSEPDSAPSKQTGGCLLFDQDNRPVGRRQGRGNQ